MLTILTHSPQRFSWEHCKGVIKKILGQKRGPSAVTESLHRGLSELHIPHNIDPSKKDIGETVHVISGIDALRYAIALKKTGVIKRLIAGPTLVITPFDNEKVLLSPEIDLILFPSQWPKDFFVSLAPELQEKIKIWPAGVAIPDTVSKKDGSWIVYNKIGTQNPLSIAIKKKLSEKNIPHTEIVYGEFNQLEYFNLLTTASGMIYLSNSESQGIALQEAWARDIPTLIYNRGYWQRDQYAWKDSKISAPYLTDQSGRFFDSIESFEKEIDYMTSRDTSFTPREYTQTHLSDRISAKIYTDILQI